MATANDFADKLSVEGDAVDCGHDIWLPEKIERGLTQSRDRVTMIPVEQVLRDLN